jgi:hypothetical protein
VKLQVNQNGAWKTVVVFDDARRLAVQTALPALHQALGSDAKWCLLSEGGTRTWLDLPRKLKP